MRTSAADPYIFEQILSTMDKDVFVVDRDCRIIYAKNKILKEIFPDDDYVGKSIYEVFKNLRPQESTLRKVLETGEPIRNKMCVYFDALGRRRVAIINTYPIIRGGEIIGAYEFGDEITGMDNLSGYLMQKHAVAPAVSQKKRQVTVNPSKNETKAKAYYTVEDIAGESPAIVRVRQEIAIAANSSSNLFIYGATGTGKEMIAQAVYSWNDNAGKVPFVAYNCAAIPEALLESILFGTVKGSFTGAENKMGLFEYANGGVVFLDEINSMPLALQAKVLRVIQENKVRRVGGYEEIPVNFRLISSTNTEPGKMLRTGMLREDLFYRLNVLHIEIPPLFDRKEDIPLLVQAFIEQLNSQLQKNIWGCHEDAMALLKSYSWPGNVRELRNCIERSMHMCQGPMIMPEDIQFFSYQSAFFQQPDMPGGEEEKPLPFRDAMAQTEVNLIKRALDACDGNHARAARYLELAPQTLHNKLLKYDLK